MNQEAIVGEVELIRKIMRLRESEREAALKAGVDLEIQQANLESLRTEAKQRTKARKEREANPDWGGFS